MLANIIIFQWKIEQIGLETQNIKETKFTFSMWKYNKCICLGLKDRLLE